MSLLSIPYPVQAELIMYHLISVRQKRGHRRPKIHTLTELQSHYHLAVRAHTQTRTRRWINHSLRKIQPLLIALTHSLRVRTQRRVMTRRRMLLMIMKLLQAVLVFQSSPLRVRVLNQSRVQMPIAYRLPMMPLWVSIVHPLTLKTWCRASTKFSGWRLLMELLGKSNNP